MFVGICRDLSSTTVLEKVWQRPANFSKIFASGGGSGGGRGRGGKFWHPDMKDCLIYMATRNPKSFCPSASGAAEMVTHCDGSSLANRGFL